MLDRLKCNPDQLMGMLVARAYNRFFVDRACGCITKSSNNQRIQDEINYYRTIPADLAVFFPRIISSTVSCDGSNMTLEFYDYPNLGELMLTEQSGVNWENIFQDLFKIVTLWATKCRAPGSSACAKKMYINKTEDEYQNFVESYDLDLFSVPSLIINGVNCLNFESIWPDVKVRIEQKLFSYESSFLHGDCCLSNILFGARRGIYRFIDPRGSFGQQGYIGDNRYDVAKLYHSCHGGYEFIINDRYRLDMHNTRYNVELPLHRRECQQAFENTFFGAYAREEISLIEGLIYVGMAARHYDCRRRQAAMYLSGVKLLNEAVAI